MTKLFFFSLLTLLPAISSAKTMTCQINKNNTVLFESDLRATCRDEGFALSLKGVGLGLYGQITQDNNATAGILLQCFTMGEPIGKFYGANANVGVIANVGVGLFVNQSGTCALVGAGLSGYGASLTGVEMEIIPLK